MESKRSRLLQVEKKLTQSIPLTPALRVQCNLIVVAVIFAHFAPINDIYCGLGPPKTRVVDAVRRPIHHHALACLDFFLCIENDLRCQEIESSNFVFRAGRRVKQAPCHAVRHVGDWGHVFPGGEVRGPDPLIR